MTEGDDLTPRWFDRRADGFRHAVGGGLWLAPLVYMQRARFGPGWYGKVVSANPERLLRWAARAGVPARGLEAKSLPDVDSGPRTARRRVPAYHIDLWGPRLALAYDPAYLARVAGRSVAVERLQARAGDDDDRPAREVQVLRPRQPRR